MKNFLSIINNATKHNNKTIRFIANKIIDCIKQNISVETSKKLASLCNVSLSMITKFVVQLNYKNVNEVLFLIRISQEDFIETKDIKTKKRFPELVKLIVNARKILLVGRGNADIVNRDFKAKLDRLDFWVQITNSKYEEIGLSRLCNKKDLIIINSVTMQHEYLEKIIKNRACNIVIITTAKVKYRFNNIKIIHYKADHKEIRFDRIYSIDSRNNVQRILDSVFEDMLSIPGNIELLKLTSYK